jgi:Fe-S cluster assembly protein SufD
VPCCNSNELYKGIIDEKAVAVFNGKILVRRDAQKTNAYQSNKNILLSDEATINTKPQLEIYADDVKCSHGATSGSIDQDSMFYLKARGIGEEKARALLLNAFAANVIEKISSPVLRTEISRQIAKRLNLEDTLSDYNFEQN